MGGNRTVELKYFVFNTNIRIGVETNYHLTSTDFLE